MRLLLDAHAFLWFAGAPERLAAPARQAIVDADVVSVSAASVWEISTKMMLGKLHHRIDDVPGEIREWGFEAMSVTAEHACAAGRLPFHHRDPFDRILVAQAQIEGFTIVSRDAVIRDYQVTVLEA